MRLSELSRNLAKWDMQGRRVFTISDIRKMFPDDQTDSFLVQLRLVAAGENPVIRRACRGVYVYNRSSRPKTDLIEEIARTIRRGHHSYVSLESALSEHGWISQIPVGRLTVITTGRSGEFRTPWGDIEFTHTERPLASFAPDLVDIGRPLRMANPERALTDLKRVGRNTHLVQPITDEEPEYAQLS